MNVYGDLFNAIWRRATLDDVELARKKARREGHKAAYNLYIARTKEEVEERDERFKAIYKDISDFTKLKSDKIENRIQELVLQEAKKWPYNKDLKPEDELYTKLLEELVEGVKEFAYERMTKRWYKL